MERERAPPPAVLPASPPQLAGLGGRMCVHGHATAPHIPASRLFLHLTHSLSLGGGGGCVTQQQTPICLKQSYGTDCLPNHAFPSHHVQRSFSLFLISYFFQNVIKTTIASSHDVPLLPADVCGPQLLPCGHSVCSKCVDRSISAESAYAIMSDAERMKTIKQVCEEGAAHPEPDRDGMRLTCLVCGAVHTRGSVKPNPVLGAYIADALKTEPTASEEAKEEPLPEPPKCGFCGKPATVYCACCKALCKEHSEFMHVSGPLKDHIISDKFPTTKERKPAHHDVSLCDLASALPCRPAKLGLPRLTCPKHRGHSRDLFCKTCMTLVCSECKDADHKRHEFCSDRDGVAEIERLLEGVSDELCGKSETWDKTEKCYKNRCDVIEEERRRALEELDKGFEALNQKLKSTHEGCRRYTNRMFDTAKEVVTRRLEAAKAARSESAGWKECVERVKSEEKGGVEEYLGLCSRDSVLLESLRKMLNSTKLMEDTILADETYSGERYTFGDQIPREMDELCKRSVKEVSERVDRVLEEFCNSFFSHPDADFIEVDLSKVAASSSEDAFPAGKSSAHDGGTIFDPKTRTIIATSGNYDSGKSLSVITLQKDGRTATTSQRSCVVPFGTHGQYPVFDGSQFVYFFQSEDGSNNRMCKMDIATFAFTECAAIPSSCFSEYCHGCWHAGSIFMVDGNKAIQMYSPSTNSWTSTEISLPNKAYLVEDPVEPDCLLAMVRDKGGLVRVNLKTKSKTTLTTPPGEFGLGCNNRFIAVRVQCSQFIAFASLDSGSNWYTYSSKTNTWTRLSNWKDNSRMSGHIVFDKHTKSIYYQPGDVSVYQAVHLV